ncbi:MAG TPA: Wzt carbohydrate-binding domain-containing protein [Candidatus Competibacter sp.]|nr:Wzt carbohydrate-binding domain-containing protein [Candidatus Competibacter sp.]
MIYNKFLFDHIYKAGGTTLERVFQKILGHENVTFGLVDRAQNAIKQYHNYAMITGHFWFAPNEKLDTNRYYLTMLRHPVDRILSHYFFAKNDVSARGGNLAIELAKTMSLDEYVFSNQSQISEIIENFQTHHYLQIEWNGSDQLTDDTQLELAKKALLHYKLAGVFHQLTEFIDVLCYECRWPVVREIPRVNITSKRPKLSEIDKKIIRRLEELNQLDIALYEYATRMFNEKKRQILHECIEQRNQEIYNLPTLLPHQGALLPQNFPPEEEERKPATEVLPPANFGNRQVEIVDIEIKGVVSLTNTLFSSEEIAIRVVFRAHIDVENLTVGIHIHDCFGRLAFGTNSECLGYTLYVHANGVYFVDYRFRNDLGIGVYTVGAALHIGSSHLSSCFHWRDEVTQFQVVGNIGYHFEGAAKVYPQLRCGILDGNPTDIQILPAAHDWPRLQQIAIHTPKLTEFRAQICLLQALEQLHPNEVVAIEAEITNTSGQIWGSTGQSPVHLSYHWQNLSGEWLEFDGSRTPLPYDIAPGKTFRHYLTIKSPSQSGDALLQLTLVQEGVAWFDKQGYPPLEIRVRIGE